MGVHHLQQRLGLVPRGRCGACCDGAGRSGGCAHVHDCRPARSDRIHAPALPGLPQIPHGFCVLQRVFWQRHAGGRLDAQQQLHAAQAVKAQIPVERTAVPDGDLQWSRVGVQILQGSAHQIVQLRFAPMERVGRGVGFFHVALLLGIRAALGALGRIRSRDPPRNSLSCRQAQPGIRYAP